MTYIFSSPEGTTARALEESRELGVRIAAARVRTLPGKITREAPPGPEMTPEQFELAVEDLTHDAARWRWLRAHWSSVIMEMESVPSSGAAFQLLVDRLIRGLVVTVERLDV